MIDLIITAIVLIIAVAYDMFASRMSRTANFTAGSDTADVCMADYAKYQQSEQILKETPGANMYEKRNSVERLMITLANETDADATYAQFANEIEQKQHKPGARAAARAREILSGKTQNNSPSHYTINDSTFRYRNYTRTIPPARMRLLRELGGDNAVARMLMRYAWIMPGSQHWNIPRECYAQLYEAGYRVEGFASPVNSQLLPYADASICSLFPDVDAPFGSIGSFFDADLAGKATVVNPPFIDSMFTAVARKITNTLTAASLPTKFFVTIAAWRDSAGFKELLSASRFAAILPANTHYYRNTNEPTEPKIIARFPTAIFELAANMPAEPLEYYTNIMKSNATDPINLTYELLRHDKK